MKRNTFKILLGTGVLFICIKMVLLSSCSGNPVLPDTTSRVTTEESYSIETYDEGYYPLNFNSIYYIDTTNMTIYYDDIDQFDMDNLYEENPSNINDDGLLMIHVNKSTLINLMNSILQYMQIDDYSTRYYIQSKYGISINDCGEYWISFIGN